MLHTEFHNATIICIASTVCPEHIYTCVTSLWLLYRLSFKYVVRQASFVFHGFACLRVVRCIRPTRPTGDTKANIWAWNQHFAIGTIRQMARAPILPVWLWKERKYFTMYRIYFMRMFARYILPAENSAINFTCCFFTFLLAVVIKWIMKKNWLHRSTKFTVRYFDHQFIDCILFKSVIHHIYIFAFRSITNY